MSLIVDRLSEHGLQMCSGVCKYLQASRSVHCANAQVRRTWRTALRSISSQQPSGFPAIRRNVADEGVVLHGAASACWTPSRHLPGPPCCGYSSCVPRLARVALPVQRQEHHAGPISSVGSQVCEHSYFKGILSQYDKSRASNAYRKRYVCAQKEIRREF